MTATREAGQTQASADALAVYMDAAAAAMAARCEVARIGRQLREARKAARAAEAAERAAEVNYLETPYA